MFLGRVDDDVGPDRRSDEDPEAIDLYDLIALEGLGNEMRPYLSTGDPQSNDHARLSQLERLSDNGKCLRGYPNQENDTGCPDGTSSTIVRPGARRSAVPDESVNFVGSLREERDHVPSNALPPRRTIARPLPIRLIS